MNGWVQTSIFEAKIYEEKKKKNRPNLDKSSTIWDMYSNKVHVKTDLNLVALDGSSVSIAFWLCFSSATPTTCMSSLTKTIKLLFGLSLFLFFLGACFSPSLSWYNHHLSKIHLQTCAVPLMWNFLILGGGVAVTEDGNATSWSWSFESQLQSQLQSHYSHNLHHSQKEDGLIRYFGDESEAPDEQ